MHQSAVQPGNNTKETAAEPEESQGEDPLVFPGLGFTSVFATLH